MDIIARYIDPDLFMIIAITAILLLLLKMMFKFVSGFRILKIIITTSIAVGIIFMSVRYIQQNEEIFSKQKGYFVYGNIEFVSKSLNKVQLNSVRSSFPQNGKGEVIVNGTAITEVVDKINGTSKPILLNDLNKNDVVLIYCEETSIGENSKEVTARKIIRKYRATRFTLQ
jgi:hypothetical protein